MGDEPRPSWYDTLTQLSDRDIEIVVLTGDDEAATDFLDRNPAVDHVFAGVPPVGKTATIRQLQSRGQVTMVGDGTNDASALATAGLRISLGGGTALASDAADIFIVNDDLAAVETTFDLADAARRRVKQNNGLALLYNGITMPLAATGLLNRCSRWVRSWRPAVSSQRIRFETCFTSSGSNPPKRQISSVTE